MLLPNKAGISEASPASIHAGRHLNSYYDIQRVDKGIAAAHFDFAVKDLIYGMFIPINN